MTEMYPASTRELAKLRRSLATDQQSAFDSFSRAVFADGALSAKVKQIIAVAVAHVTQCPYCIKGHTGAALRRGYSARIDGGSLVAAEMRAGAAYAHSTLMLTKLDEESAGGSA
jgi:AhpD family alkylhydroperoxidase